MELLEETLKKVWPGLSDANWISVDTGGHKIGPKILRLRVTERGIDDKPIILYGFRSFESLVRSEKEHPRLLVSPGVHYLHLPVSWKRMENILNQAKEQKLDREELKTELMDSAFAGRALARMESVLAHNIGNFLGSEKLLFGSHLAGMIDGNDFENILEKIRNNQSEALGDTQEYPRYRLSQANYTPQKILRQSQPSIMGQILYIDDHAHLGWAQAVGSALWGRCSTSKSTRIGDLNLITISNASGRSMLSVLNRKGLSSSEDAFLKAALQIVGDNGIFSGCDMILLDLRLRWKEDEKIGNQVIDELSGIKVLRKIRETNAAIPVVVLTASRKAANMEKVLNLGADAYFIKEVPHPDEEKDDIKDYHQRFVRVMEITMRKSYLAEVWQSIRFLEKTTDNNDNKLFQEVKAFLKQSIGLLRTRSDSYERKAMHLNTVGEAVIKLNLVKEALLKATGFQKPFLDKGFLLTGLRNFSAHPLEDTVTENDAKIAIYLTFRLLTKDANQLGNLADSLFSEMPIEPQEYPKIMQLARKKLQGLIEAKLEGISELPAQWGIKKLAKIQTMDSTVLSKLLLPPADHSIHTLLRNSKQAHYIMFLCRMQSPMFLYTNYLPSDHRVIGAICRQASITI